MNPLKRWKHLVDADGLRDELLHQRTKSLGRRRWLARLAALGLVDAAAMALFQTGAIHRLPDLPGFDSERVVSSRAAYLLGAPDATLGAAQYAGTLLLASLVDTPRLRRRGGWALLLGAVVAMGAVGAAAYLRDMIVHEQRACAYCIPALLINFAMVPLAAPEVLEGVRRLRS